MQYNVSIIRVPIRITEEDRHKMYGCLVSSLAITTPLKATREETVPPFSQYWPSVFCQEKKSILTIGGASARLDQHLPNHFSRYRVVVLTLLSI